jgi:hypothetical protein
MQVTIPTKTETTIEVELPFYGIWIKNSVVKVIGENEYIFAFTDKQDIKIEHSLLPEMGAFMLAKIIDNPISESEFNEGVKKVMSKLTKLLPEIKEVDIPTLRDLGNSIVDNNNLQ